MEKSHIDFLQEKVQTLENEIVSINEWKAGLTNALDTNINLSINDNINRKIVIHGVELTQATQYFNSINDQGTGFGSDNSMKLVANKPLILRVYCSGVNIGDSTGNFKITGQVIVQRILNNDEVTTKLILTPINNVIIDKPLDQIDRSNIDDTLNFLVPGILCHGRLKFIIRVFDPLEDLTNVELLSKQKILEFNKSSQFLNNLADKSFIPNFPVQNDAATSVNIKSVYARFERAINFPIHVVFLHNHNTNNGNDYPTPTFSEFWDKFENLLDRFPIGYISLTNSFGEGTNLDEEESMNILCNKLRKAKVFASSPAIYLGIFDGFSHPPNYIAGKGGHGVAACIISYINVMAHEVGHALGRKHAPTAFTPDPDPDFPTYPGLGPGKIGEVGFSSLKNVTYPSTNIDIMGYSDFYQWISPYTYEAIMEAIEDLHFPFPPIGPTDVPTEVLYLLFNISSDNKVEVNSGFQIMASRTNFNRNDIDGSIKCQLLDNNERVLKSNNCSRLEYSDGDFDDFGSDYEVSIPWNKNAAFISIIKKDKSVLKVKIAKETPKIKLDMKINEGEKPNIVLKWKSEYTTKSIDYILRFSNDNGSTWRVLDSDIKESKKSFMIEELPGGDMCMFQLLASAGFRTTTVTSKTFSVPRQPRKAIIVSPDKDFICNEGDMVNFRGVGYSISEGCSKIENTYWSSDIDGYLGSGWNISTNKLSAGFHTISLILPNGLGDIISSSIRLMVHPSES